MSHHLNIRGKLVTVDEVSIPLLEPIKWRIDNRNRVMARISGKETAMHRFLMDAPEDMEIDHINGDPLDNRLANLRICTHAENMRNRKMHANNKSGHKGVYRELANKSSPYRAEIKVDGKKIRLGSFKTAEAAGTAYKIASIKYHGEFARL